ncbi:MULTISPECIES: L-histidine N(alpha)-methyltransferase [unclassified Streptomyces]|uniref:L-histidine N(alpha)-methyltransferase n=1 Tax=unclassified Streptomyces TaxID=2593676 RepID=UPI001163F8D7|nr:MULTISPECIES: L-histidine N(alpha)-methyltransferase [unclassified Streptomyces]NMI54869.1 L-histidine N(alpha)-methyltransferase [Streptomyces sp. RLA2-12]QDN62595.1 L-histidine N(alpha)-methyltransferase [Streptomyces sp. S1D4-20]QDO65349.1 L-histidine N(alpha)-methyltransferase [Streptomyces sp. RLB1-8]QDN72646.1 L-histidine N(alpha)-methyltransferase [Streptomyces sp. S1D4-14]QDO55175.1 L-histidine N(alpha)-methyltransferase [Streptomyces sp. RLB3-5]
MRMKARSALKAQNPAPDPAVDFALVEALRTEISAKFRQRGIRVESAAAGFALGRHWNDSCGRFTRSLTFPAT